MTHAWQNDPDLVIRSVRGEVDAFAMLVRRYRAAVFGLAYHVLRDFDDAEDAAQEAFLQAFRKLDQLHRPDSFGSWLREIALNEARRLLRRKSREPARTRQSEPRAHAAGHPDLWAALDRLPEDQHAALCLRFLGGYSNADAAAFLGVPIETLRSRLRLAKQRLRKELMLMVEHTLSARRPDEQFIEAVVSVITRLRRQIPRIAPEDLRDFLHLPDEELHRRAKTRMSEVATRLHMPPSAGVGELRIADLPEEAREMIRLALYEHWLVTIVETLRHPPGYLEHFEDAEVEFGRYASADLAGRPYATIYRRRPDGTRESLQLGPLDPA